MKTYSASLALCAGNSPVTGKFHSQRPVTLSFDVFFDQRLNKQLSKQKRCRWFETPLGWLWRHCNGMIDATHVGHETSQIVLYASHIKVKDRKKIFLLALQWSMVNLCFLFCFVYLGPVCLGAPQCDRCHHLFHMGQISLNLYKKDSEPEMYQIHLTLLESLNHFQCDWIQVYFCYKTYITKCELFLAIANSSTSNTFLVLSSAAHNKWGKSAALFYVCILDTW